MKKAMLTNLIYWGVAILLPIGMRVVPTSTGASPRIFELVIPLFQIMLAFAAARNFSSALRAAGNPEQRD
ncbi:MAG: hypothetical protein KDA38_07055 [Planctomycetales bacterium]|nr:hypothetical protein [Planctomycetales bacterium]MCA9227484.1 hypothetical protein [Planctomycetales bacterium]